MVEYFIYTGHREITMDDLPPTVLRRSREPAAAPVPRQEDLRNGWQEDAFQFVLEQLYLASEAQAPIGREALLQKAREAHIPLSQQEIRGILTGMAEQGLVRVSRGRGGSRLTPAGRALWENGHS